MSVIVRPIEANLTHDIDLIERMDPYLKIYLGGQQKISSVCKDGGKHSFWNDILYFTNPESQLIIQVWDSNMLMDDIVAEGTYNIQQLYNYPGYRSDNEFVDVFHKGRPAGRIKLSMQLQGGGLNQGGLNQGGLNQGGLNHGGFNQGGHNHGGYNNQGGFGGNFNNNGW